MRVLIAGQTYYPAKNGQAIFSVNLAEGLARRGHTVLAIIPSTSSGSNHFDLNGVQIQTIRSYQLNYLHQDVHYTAFPEKEVRRIIRQFQPEIVHIHDHYPISRAALIAAHHHGIPVIGTNHFMPENIDPYIPMPKSLKPAVNWTLWHWMLELYNQLDLATAPSRTAAAILRQQGLHPPVYPISCGVDLHRFHPDPKIIRREWRIRYGLDPDRTLFLFVGRVDGEKRLDVLLNAMQYMDRDDFQLGVVGKGAAQDKLEKLAIELDLGKRVHFTGYVPGEDLPALLNSADIFAMPSEAELLSIATLEAMACGLPVLVARAQALPELVDEGVNGCLFQSGNPEDAARAMTWLLEHREQYQEMGLVSLEKAQAHDLGRIVQRYEQIYRMVAEKPAPVFLPGQVKPLRRLKFTHSRAIRN